MARLTDQDREKILSDWKAGSSQNYLAKKYDVSPATINKLCKGIEQSNIEIVNSQIAINTAMAEKSEYEVNSIQQAVSEKTRHLQFLHNATLKNISVMAKKLNEDATILDHKQAQDAIHKAGQTLGVIEQFAKSGDVNVNATAAIQNNTVKTLDDFYDQ